MKYSAVFCGAMAMASVLAIDSPAIADKVDVVQCHFESKKPSRSGDRIAGSARYWCDHNQNPTGNRRALHVSISQWDYHKGWITRATNHNDGDFSTDVTVKVSTGCKFGRWRITSQVHVHNVFNEYWTPGSYSDELNVNC